MERWTDRAYRIEDALLSQAEGEFKKGVEKTQAYKEGYVQACKDYTGEIKKLILKDRAEQKEKAKERYKKVFICSPFRGDIEKDTEKAAGYCQMARRQGYLPIAPRLLFSRFLDEGDEDERQLSIQMGIDLIEYCSEVWVFGEATDRMMAEIAAAIKSGKIVRAMEYDADLGGDI